MKPQVETLQPNVNEMSTVIVLKHAMRSIRNGCHTVQTCIPTAILRTCSRTCCAAE